MKKLLSGYVGLKHALAFFLKTFFNITKNIGVYAIPKYVYNLPKNI